MGILDRPSLVLFVLATADVPPRPPLRGPVLVRLLGDLGLSEGAARSTILRMRRAGWLSSTRAGPTVGYSPAPAIVAGHRRRLAPPAPVEPSWDGSFHALLLQVPERRRAYRDALRRAARLAGYRNLQPALMIAATDRRDEIEPVLDAAPKDASILFARLALSTGDARSAAAELWELDALARRHRELVASAARVAAVGEASPLGGPEALRGLAAATIPIYQALMAGPGLPSELLPPQWPQRELYAAFASVVDRLMPAAQDYIEDLRA